MTTEYDYDKSHMERVTGDVVNLTEFPPTLSKFPWIVFLYFELVPNLDFRGLTFRKLSAL